MKKTFTFFGIGMLALMPMMAFAQPQTVGGILGTISLILNTLIPILITLAVVYVIWGIIQYATAKDDDKQAGGKSIIIKGIIALFVIVSLWGLVAILGDTFGVSQTAGPSGSTIGAGATNCAPGSVIGLNGTTPILCPN